MVTFSKWILAIALTGTIAIALYVLIPGLGSGLLLDTPPRLPDLIIDGLQIRTSATGKSVVATVRNIGTAGAPSAAVEYFLGTERLQSSQFSPALAPGASANIAPSPIVSIEKIAGRPFRAVVDFYHKVREQNELNNEYEVPNS